MEIAAKMSSKGQITVPKSVRDALGIGEGDIVVFRVEGNRAVLARAGLPVAGRNDQGPGGPRQRSVGRRHPQDTLGPH